MPMGSGIKSLEFPGWLSQLVKHRLDAGVSVEKFKFAKSRVRQMKGPNLFPELGESDACSGNSVGKGGVLYWMNRDQRVQDNWALLYAQRLALKFKVPLHVCFCLVPFYQANTLRHFTFMIDGLVEVEKECRDLSIPFHLVQPEIGHEVEPKTKRKRSTVDEQSGEFNEFSVSGAIIKLLQDLNVGCVVTDFSPLRAPTKWIEQLAKDAPEKVPICQVDAHNVIPVWYASDHLEYAARTIRKKLHEKSTELCTEFPPVIAHPHGAGVKGVKQVDWASVKSKFDGEQSIKPVKWAHPGSEQGLHTLFSFIHTRIKSYDSNRNDPTKCALSDLSPWFHFGQIAPQRALLEVRRVRDAHPKSADAFAEEAFVRRELSDNFCFYNPNYDSIKGAYKWAQDTLKLHAKDKRDPGYTSAQMEEAKTKDDLWNAAQKQLVQTGKIHGFMRMYWAKKILEWHVDGPESALQLALHMNDKYSLDGTDPNGVVGVMWSICGIHDQGWAERPIYGKIRCMTYKGCKGKFPVDTFVARYS